MTQFYSNPRRAKLPHALPDCECFYVDRDDIKGDFYECGLTEPGWYYWYCLPGCLPDGEPEGPYETEAECIAAVHDETLWQEAHDYGADAEPGRTNE